MAGSRFNCTTALSLSWVRGTQYNSIEHEMISVLFWTKPSNRVPSAVAPTHLKFVINDPHSIIGLRSKDIFRFLSDQQSCKQQQRTLLRKASVFCWFPIEAWNFKRKRCANNCPKREKISLPHVSCLPAIFPSWAPTLRNEHWQWIICGG